MMEKGKSDVVEEINVRHMQVCQRVVVMAMALEDWETVRWALDIYRRYKVWCVKPEEGGGADGD